MTTQSGVGKKGKEYFVDEQGEYLHQEQGTPGPDELDENWWAAVLADEPLLETYLEPQGYSCEEETFKPVEERFPSSVNWEKVQTLFTKDEIIRLRVTSFNRGGVLVEGVDIHGFVPVSHLIDLPVDVPDGERDQYFRAYLDRDINLKVIECDREKERIVFSERAALAGVGTRKNLLSNLAEGDIVDGFITNITDFGVFVDLGGLEGLVHVSELSWGRVHHPSEVLKLGDKVTTMVVEVFEEQGRIALSLKRLETNPWDEISTLISIGDILEAVITKIVKYGAFARLDQGVEGLIHISNITFPEGCTRIVDFLDEGVPVKVSVISMEVKKRRLGFKLES